MYCKLDENKMSQKRRIIIKIKKTSSDNKIEACRAGKKLCFGTILCK